MPNWRRSRRPLAAAPRKPGILKIETVNLSEAELATLAERKATTAMAKGQLRDAQDNYYQVLAHDPHNQGAREQLAGLLYGEGRLSEASQLLEEGLRLDPGQADFRLLLARLAISGGDQRKALDWLTGYRPDLASNLDYYATWAGLCRAGSACRGGGSLCEIVAPAAGSGPLVARARRGRRWPGPQPAGAGRLSQCPVARQPGRGLDQLARTADCPARP